MGIVHVYVFPDTALEIVYFCSDVFALNSNKPSDPELFGQEMVILSPWPKEAPEMVTLLEIAC